MLSSSTLHAVVASTYSLFPKGIVLPLHLSDVASHTPHHSSVPCSNVPPSSSSSGRGDRASTGADVPGAVGSVTLTKL